MARLMGPRPSCGSSSMSLVVMARETCASASWTAISVASTETDSVTAPSSIFTTSVTVSATLRITLLCTALRKPSASTVTVYSLGASEGKTKCPSGSLVVRALICVLTFRASILAPGITAPVLSCTVPSSRDDDTCPQAQQLRMDRPVTHSFISRIFTYLDCFVDLNGAYSGRAAAREYTRTSERSALHPVVSVFREHPEVSQIRKN